MIFLGIDAGSRTLKAAAVDAAGRLLGMRVADQGQGQANRISELADRLLEELGATRRDVRRTVATGYGRDLVHWAQESVTEISCQARALHHLAPAARTLVDVGGQDSKVVRVDAEGRVVDFALNDRCAAGTGRFLEMIAARLETPVEEIAGLAARAAAPAPVSSMCAVFAESEIVSLLAEGAAPAAIAGGVLESVCGRIAALAARIAEPPVVFTGGVAAIPGFGCWLNRALGHEAAILEHPRTTGALGAARLAAARG